MMCISATIMFLSVYAMKPDSKVFMLSAMLNPCGAKLEIITQIVLRSCCLACDLFFHVVMIFSATYGLSIFHLYIYCGYQWQIMLRCVQTKYLAA